MQQDLKLALMAPILCAVFRLIFIEVYGPKKTPFGAWRKWYHCFRYGFQFISYFQWFKHFHLITKGKHPHCKIFYVAIVTYQKKPSIFLNIITIWSELLYQPPLHLRIK